MCPEDYAYELHVAVISHGDQRRQRLGRVPGLTADRPLIILGIRRIQHLVLLLEYMLLRRLRRRYRILQGLYNIEKFRMAEYLPPDQRHILGAGIMVGIVQSVRVREIRILTAKLPAARIHPLDKPVIIISRILSDILCNRIRHLVGRSKKRRV